MTAKTFERTYDVTLPGPFAPLDPKTKAGLTRRLRADAKKEGHDTLGDTYVVSSTGTIGAEFKITVRATIGEAPTADNGDDADEADEINDPAKA